MPDQLASTVADTFIRGWVQHHGVPHTITTDRGTNFESSLFNSLLKRLGSQHIHTTAYHPRHNGMVERWDRHLKDALRASADDFSWVDCLPLIMLNLHVSQRDDGQPSPAEVVYGSSLMLPAGLITLSTERIQHNAVDYSHLLKAHMQNVRPIITRHNTAKNKIYQHNPTLDSCSKVFLRKMNKTGLQDNYVGSFAVITCSEKYFTIRLSNGKRDNVTIDRVKPCFSESDTLPRPSTEEHHEVYPPAPVEPVEPAAYHDYPAPQQHPASPAPPAPPAPVTRPDPYLTRYGRVCRKPDWLMFQIYKDIDFFSQKTSKEGG